LSYIPTGGSAPCTIPGLANSQTCRLLVTALLQVTRISCHVSSNTMLYSSDWFHSGTHEYFLVRPPYNLNHIHDR